MVGNGRPSSVRLVRVPGMEGMKAVRPTMRASRRCPMSNHDSRRNTYDITGSVEAARRNRCAFGRWRAEGYRIRSRERAASDIDLRPGSVNHTGGGCRRRGLNDCAVGSALRRLLQEEDDERNRERRTQRRTARLIVGPAGPVPGGQGAETPDLPRRNAHQQAPRKESPCPR